MCLPGQNEANQAHQNLVMYIVISCCRVGLATRVSLRTWQQTFDNKTKQTNKKKKVHWKKDRNSSELNIDNRKSVCQLIYTHHLLK